MIDLIPEPEDTFGKIFEPPPKMALFTLGGLVFLCMMLGSGIIALACHLQGIDIQEVLSSFGKDSSLDERNFMRGTLLLNHMTTFLVPALIAGWIFYKKRWPEAALLDQKPAPGTLGLGILFVMAAFPLAQLAFTANRWLVEQIPFLDALVKTEAATDNLVEGLLVMQSPWEVLFSLLVIAVVPAVGEEMVFRGFLQRHLIRLTKKPALGIGLTALLFSLAHFQIQRFLAILLLGAVLGVLFHWTKNLWVPVAAHFLNNGAQVVIAYFNQEKLSELNAGADEDLPVTVILASAVLFAATGYQLWKKSRDAPPPPPEIETPET